MSIEFDTLEVAPDASGCPSWRAVLLGAILCAVTGVAGPYWTIYLQSSRMFEDYHTAGATFFLFFLFLAFNLGLVHLWRKLALRPDELMATGAMMLVGGSIVTSGLIAYFIPAISSAYYYANSSNQWNTEIWPYLPKLLSPLDPNGGTVAIKKFWMGLPAGEPIPWGPWAKPLIIWGIFLMAMFLCMMAIMTIMRKQWMDYEHLSYPIAQVPAELCSAAAAPGAEGSILRSKAFWIGLAVTFLIASLGGTAHYLGSTAPFRIRAWVRFAEGPWELAFYLDPVVVGLVFLIPNRVAFTVWFIALLSWFLRCFMEAYNLRMSNDWALGDETNHLAMGAAAVFAVGSLWLSRGHLKRAFACAFGRGERAYDSGEPASYRVSFIIILAALAVMVAWLRWMGLGLPYALLLVVMTLAIYFTMARVVAQCGLPMLSPPAYPSNVMAALFGSAALGSKQIGMLGMHYGWHFDMRNSVMSGSGHGMFLTRLRRSGLMWAMLLGLVISYVSAALCAVWVSYRHGGANMDPWFFGTYPPLPWIWAREAISLHSDPSYGRIIWQGAGALLMAALMVAQRVWFWWPINPVGLLISSSHMVYYFWFSVFFAWVVKVLLVTLAGPATFRPARRFFIGLVMGYFLAGGIWAVIDTITGSAGNSVFYI